MKKASARESSIKARIMARYKAEGWLCIRLIQTNCNGIPDLLLLKDGQARFIEVKRPGCRPRPLQEYRMKQLAQMGFKCEILTE